MAAPTVVLTRDPVGNQRWAAGLERAGFAVLSAPMIETAPLDAELPDLSNYDWIVLTSPRAVPYLQTLMAKINLSQAKIPPIAAVGPATAQAATAAGWAVKFQPHPTTAAALGQQLEPVRGYQILIARSSLAGPRLAAALTARGATVTDLPIYMAQPRTAPDSALARLLEAPAPAVIVLASPSAVRALSRLHPAALCNPAVTIGPTTTAAATSAGFNAVRQAAAPTLPSLISAIKLL